MYQGNEGYVFLAFSLESPESKAAPQFFKKN
jgi:hypothetical protein